MSENKSPRAGSAQEDSPLPLDALIDEYKKDVDHGLLRANLKLTVEERLLNLQKFVKSIEELREAVKATNK